MTARAMPGPLPNINTKQMNVPTSRTPRDRAILMRNVRSIGLGPAICQTALKSQMTGNVPSGVETLGKATVSVL